MNVQSVLHLSCCMAWTVEANGMTADCDWRLLCLCRFASSNHTMGSLQACSLCVVSVSIVTDQSNCSMSFFSGGMV